MSTGGTYLQGKNSKGGRKGKVLGKMQTFDDFFVMFFFLFLTFVTLHACHAVEPTPLGGFKLQTINPATTTSSSSRSSATVSEGQNNLDRRNFLKSNITDVSEYLAFLTRKEAERKEPINKLSKQICGEMSPLLVIFKKMGQDPEKSSDKKMAMIFKILEKQLPGSNMFLFARHVTYRKCLYRSIDSNYV